MFWISLGTSSVAKNVPPFGTPIDHLYLKSDWLTIQLVWSAIRNTLGFKRHFFPKLIDETYTFDTYWSSLSENKQLKSY